VGVTEGGEVAGEAFAFGLEGVVLRLEAIELHVFGEGDADLARNAAEAEEAGVAAGGVCATGGGEVDEDLGAPAEDRRPELEEDEWVAGFGGIAEVAVDEAAGADDLGGGGGFGVDGEVGEDTALGGGEGAFDEMEGG